MNELITVDVNDPDFIAKVRLANSLHGDAKALVHVGSYALTSGFDKLEALLKDDQWRECGFKSIGELTDSIRFDKDIRFAAEKRKRLLVLFEEANRREEEAKREKLSNRKLAKMLGTSEKTVRRDTAANAAPGKKNTNQNKGGKTTTAANAALGLSGGQVAKLKAKQEARPEAAAQREKRMEEINAANRNLPGGLRCSIIYADPPWRYENPPMGGGNRSIENHYPTMTLEEICALGVASRAAEDAVLYLWATAPKLFECMSVIAAWGFTYRTNLVWAKDKIGMGYHVRNQHELLLIAKRGAVPPPLPADRPSSIVYADRLEHSEKPEIFAEMIEGWYPKLAKMELFRRGAARPGWEVWGNQARAAE
jgi:N6-adenosine-specific RNA methylase IME4